MEEELISFLTLHRVVKKVIEGAGKFLHKRFESFDRSSVHLKSTHEIITKNDLEAQEMIIKKIKTAFPQHRFLAEESGHGNTRQKNKSDYLWVVDPIDGTTNFSIHNPLWAISIGLFYKGEPYGGWILAPELKEFYWAKKNGGAFLNGKRIRVSKVNKGKMIHTFCYGYEERSLRRGLAYYSKQKRANLDCRQLGSAAIELAFVASGRVESIVIPGAQPWDVAAGVLLVREAKGQVTNFKNKEWKLGDRDILASNGLVHKRLLKSLREAINRE